MKTVADVNVLFAILVAGHTHHAVAWDWWEQQAPASVILCWPTRLGVLRLLTNTIAMGAHPVQPETALSAWEALAADARAVWCEPIAGHELYFRRYVSGRKPAPNLWNDAWLAAHAESLGVGLTSFDSDFRALELTAFEHLKQ
jgi:toxin-antitoxin system PIN domain toxin